MSGEAAKETEAAWPGPGVLLVCAGFLAAGFLAAWWCGPAPAGEMQVRVVPAPAAEVPAEP